MNDVIWEKGARVSFDGLPATVEDERCGFAMIRLDEEQETGQDWKGRIVCVRSNKLQALTAAA